MEASMRTRLDLIDDLLQHHLSLTDTAPVKSDMMQEFDVVLAQMPYVGGAESRMSDFFMRLLGFMAIRRVLRRRGVPLPVIGALEREQAVKSDEQHHAGDFSYDYVEPGPGETFDFGINYRACSFCKFAEK